MRRESSAVARYVCGWRLRIGVRPPSAETVTLLLAERSGMAHHGFNSFPGEPGVMLAQFEVEAPTLDAARQAAQNVGPAIRGALARYDGAGLIVEDLYEVRPAATLPADR